MKRLLCIISSLDIGGAETFLMKLFRSIDRSKYIMDFCVNVKGKGFYDDEVRKLGGIIHYVTPKSSNVRAFRKELFNIVQKNEYDYVLRVTSNGMGFYDLKIAKSAGASKCIARSSNSSDGDGIRVRLAHRLGRILYQRYVDVKIAPSDLAAIYTFGLSSYKAGEVIILHNGIDTNEYCFSEAGRLQIRKELGIDKNAFVVGHIGRFVKQKNHLFLIDIINEVQKLNGNSKLLLIGDGELKQLISETVRKYQLTDKVIFAGVRRDIPSCLSAMDVFVFPSLYEGMPNTIVEAQATGLPCIISDSITREANITGFVKFKSLEATAKDWANEVTGIKINKRDNVKHFFVDAGYDIDSVSRTFERSIFE